MLFIGLLRRTDGYLRLDENARKIPANTFYHYRNDFFFLGIDVLTPANHLQFYRTKPKRKVSLSEYAANKIISMETVLRIG